MPNELGSSYSILRVPKNRGFSDSFSKCCEKIVIDEIQLLLEKENVKAKVYDGKKFDCGSKTGYVEATIAMGMKDPEISDNIKKIIRELI